MPMKLYISKNLIAIMSTFEERIEYWLDLADYDLVTAKVMLESKRYLYLGFMCHQVVEKSIKAFFWFVKKTEPPYTHNLLVLSEKSTLEKILSKEHKTLLNELMPLNIQARYPNDKLLLLNALNYNKSRSLLKKQKNLTNG